MRPSALVRSPPRPRDRGGRCPSATRTWCRPGTDRLAQADRACAPARPARHRRLRKLPCRYHHPRSARFRNAAGPGEHHCVTRLRGCGRNSANPLHEPCRDRRPGRLQIGLGVDPHARCWPPQPSGYFRAVIHTCNVPPEESCASAAATQLSGRPVIHRDSPINRCPPGEMPALAACPISLGAGYGPVHADLLTRAGVDVDPQGEGIVNAAGRGAHRVITVGPAGADGRDVAGWRCPGGGGEKKCTEGCGGDGEFGWPHEQAISSYGILRVMSSLSAYLPGLGAARPPGQFPRPAWPDGGPSAGLRGGCSAAFLNSEPCAYCAHTGPGNHYLTVPWRTVSRWRGAWRQATGSPAGRAAPAKRTPSANSQLKLGFVTAYIQ